MLRPAPCNGAAIMWFEPDCGHLADYPRNAATAAIMQTMLLRLTTRGAPPPLRRLPEETHGEARKNTRRHGGLDL